MSSGTYGLTKADLERARGRSERKANFMFGGQGVINATPVYLVEEGTGKVGLYIPEGVRIFGYCKGYVTDGTVAEVFENDSEGDAVPYFTAINTAGTVTVTMYDTYLFEADTDVRVTAVANSNADCVVFAVVEGASGTRTAYVRMEVEVYYFNVNADQKALLPAFATVNPTTPE